VCKKATADVGWEVCRDDFVRNRSGPFRLSACKEEEAVRDWRVRKERYFAFVRIWGENGWEEERCVVDGLVV
jgi:hypothetical protein